MHNRQRSPNERIVRSPQHFLAGLGLIACSAVGLQQASMLGLGTLRAMGPGMLPTATSALIGIIGIALVIAAFLQAGEALSGWSWRGPIFMCLAVAAFALTIRSAGLAVAGPLVGILGGAAARDVRPTETAIFAVCATLFCIGLFRLLLGLPIPVLVIPGVIYW
ncbi:tripartite tricarboxylate transporter TctB family protein [Ensifer aridi]|uniref:tripartite tricarboxylate transporter TctB family protein n=1 Tax=Ensifer aridi TaxID=1708715 RepID=UPI000A121C32|nr:tripartite tricarboxylate transporter TctB family protein [Ensifer aridi]